MFGKGVVYDVPNHVFMEQKKFIKVGLSTENFRAYIGMIETEIENFLATHPAFGIYRQRGTSQWGAFRSMATMAELTILTASRTLQGDDVRTRLDSSFSKIYEDLDRGFAPINFLFPSLPLESYRKRDIAQKAMSDFFIDIIRRRELEGVEVSLGV